VALDCNSSILKLLAAAEFYTPLLVFFVMQEWNEGEKKTFNCFAYSKDGVVFQTSEPSRDSKSKALKQKCHK
jgi:hypothetical protein